LVSSLPLVSGSQSACSSVLESVSCLVLRSQGVAIIVGAAVGASPDCGFRRISSKDGFARDGQGSGSLWASGRGCRRSAGVDAHGDFVWWPGAPVQAVL